MVQTEVRRAKEDTRKIAAELGKQDVWKRWNLLERILTWTKLWTKDQYRLSFLLRSVYDTLPSPANIHQRGLVEDPLCKLSGKRGTMVHILCGC
jgi:hypothetical protein